MNGGGKGAPVPKESFVLKRSSERGARRIKARVARLCERSPPGNMLVNVLVVFYDTFCS